MQTLWHIVGAQEMLGEPLWELLQRAADQTQRGGPGRPRTLPVSTCPLLVACLCLCALWRFNLTFLNQNHPLALLGPPPTGVFFFHERLRCTCRGICWLACRQQLECGCLSATIMQARKLSEGLCPAQRVQRAQGTKPM